MRYPQGLRAFLMRSPVLRTGLRVLEAGCGTGALTFAVREACARRGLDLRAFHAFDLTPAMLAVLRERLRRHDVHGIELAEGDVLRPESLPPAWRDYDLVVSASMLEYVPRPRFVNALEALRSRLAPDGSFLLFITRRNPLTRVLVGRWWASNLYTRTELADAFARARFSHVAFRRFPATAFHLAPWGHVVEART